MYLLAGSPSMAVMMSPSRKLALAAGESGTTPCTTKVLKSFPSAFKTRDWVPASGLEAALQATNKYRPGLFLFATSG
jgi:hypothetical protein